MKTRRRKEEALRSILLPEVRRRMRFFGAKNLEGKGGGRMAMPSGVEALVTKVVGITGKRVPKMCLETGLV